MDLLDKMLDKHKKEEEDFNYKFNVALAIVLFVVGLIACYHIAELGKMIFLSLI